jgi:hypothetical protein
MDTYEIELTPYRLWSGYMAQPTMLVTAASRKAARACAERLWAPDRQIISITNTRTGVKL